MSNKFKFWDFDGILLKVEELPDGGANCFRLNPATGDFELDGTKLGSAMLRGEEISEDEFNRRAKEAISEEK